MDAHAAKVEYLEVLQLRQEANQLIMNGAETILAGGEDGIRFVANEQPELILAAIIGLTKVIEMGWNEHLAFVEKHFTLLDLLESIPDNTQS